MLKMFWKKVRQFFVCSWLHQLSLRITQLVISQKSNDNRDKKSNFYDLALVAVRCSELAEPITASCAKAHSAKLHPWQIDDNLDLFDQLGV